MKICSFEIAKKLKENNIYIPSMHAYAIDDIYYFPPGYDNEFHATAGKIIRNYDSCYFESDTEAFNRLVVAPMIMDILNWLADNKHIYVSIIWEPTITENNRRCVYDIKYNYSDEYYKPYNVSNELFTTYEDAMESAVKEIIDQIFK